jgi:hypothetical protein
VTHTKLPKRSPKDVATSGGHALIANSSKFCEKEKKVRKGWNPGTGDGLMPEPRKVVTLNERKFRMPQLQGIKGEAVVVYCELLKTKEMGHHPLSRRVNKMGLYLKIYISSIEAL